MKTVVRSVWTPTIKSLDVLNRTIRFIGTKETEDRTGDIIEVDGWDLENYSKNPVFLWDHNPSLGPIGRVKQITREGISLLFDVEFAPKSVSEFADQIFKLFEAGFLSAVSVGFIPKSYTFLRDEDDMITGVRFTKQELLELSAVSIPAHQDAVAASAYKKAVKDVLDKANAVGNHTEKDVAVVTLEQFTKSALAEQRSEANEEDDEVMKEQVEALQKEVAELKEQVLALTTLRETVDLSKSAMATLNTLLADKLGKNSDEQTKSQAAASDEGEKPTPAEVPAELSKALEALLGKVNKSQANFKPQGDK